MKRYKVYTKDGWYIYRKRIEAKNLTEARKKAIKYFSRNTFGEIIEERSVK